MADADYPPALLPIVEKLRTKTYDSDQENLELLKKLDPVSRKKFLSERHSLYTDESRAENILKVYAQEARSVKMYIELVDKIGVQIEDTPYFRNHLLFLISVCRVEVLERVMKVIGIIPGMLGAWLGIPPECSLEAEKVFRILLKNGFVLDVNNPRPMYDSIMKISPQHMIQTQLLFEEGCTYCSYDVGACALRKAAILGKNKTVDFFLTGDKHTPQQAADAYEILQVGMMRVYQLNRPYKLKCFRKALRIRQEHKLQPGRYFETIEDIEMMEDEMIDGKFLTFIKKCYDMCQDNYLSDAFIDTSSVYEGQSWLFWYFESYYESIMMYRHIEPAERSKFASKFRVSLSRINIIDEPTWQESLLIFNEIRHMQFAGNSGTDYLANFNELHLELSLRNDRSPKPAVTLMLSEIVDMMMTSSSHHLLTIAECLLRLEPDLSYTNFCFLSLKHKLRQYGEFPLNPRVENLDVDYGQTILLRLIRSREWQSDSHRRSMLKKFANMTCCHMDAHGHPALREEYSVVDTLSCIAARQIPASKWQALPKPYRRKVISHHTDKVAYLPIYRASRALEEEEEMMEQIEYEE